MIITGDTNIYVIGDNGGNPRKLTKNLGGDSYPAWSPDGKHIAYSSSKINTWWVEDIHVMDTNGRNSQKLTDTGSDYSPSWSPDSERITFMSYRDGNGEIYAMDANGQESSKHHQPSGRGTGAPHGLLMVNGLLSRLIGMAPVKFT